MRYIFLFPLFILLSCGKKEFKIDFSLDKEITANYNVTYYSNNAKGGATVQAVASVRDGICRLEGLTLDPTLVYITSRKGALPLVAYVKRGEVIKINGTGETPLAWNVEGNHINEELSEWRRENEETLLNNIPDSVNLAVKRYVEMNRDNPLSTILILSYFNRGIDERGYNELMGSLEEGAKDSEWLVLAARSDQLYHSYSFPARLQSLIMRGTEFGVDTLIADGKNPVLISFWQTGFNDKKALIDSLKALEKKLPDSVKNLADICLDIDSVGWRNSIKRDSLKVVKRFWTPLGLNDPTIQKMKVTSLPYYIVFDEDGAQSYRGGEMSEAFSKYRELMQKNRSGKKK